MKRILLEFVSLMWLLVNLAGFAQAASNYILYAGTYTKGESKGIYAYRYEAGSGKMIPLGLAAETVNPSFLAVAPNHKFLYAVNEIGDYKGESSGGVSAFAMDSRTGKLTLLNQTSSHGADPCYIAFDKTGKYVLVANYSGGTVAVFPILADGRIGEASSVLKDAGALGPVRDRQDAPHAHWIETGARNRFAYVADLGLDRVLIYKFDASKGSLTPGPNDQFFSARTAPGTGPRHVAFSNDGNFMYVLGELDSTVTVFSNDGKETFRQVQRISALPAGFSGRNDAAEIAVHPNGKFLYTSNRGHDSIAAFSMDKGAGRLTVIGQFPTQGKEPRHFAIDPAGRHLLVANQDSGDIAVFAINELTGRLTPTGESVKVPSPVCLVFAPAD